MAEAANYFIQSLAAGVEAGAKALESWSTRRQQKAFEDMMAELTGAESEYDAYSAYGQTFGSPLAPDGESLLPPAPGSAQSGGVGTGGAASSTPGVGGAADPNVPLSGEDKFSITPGNWNDGTPSDNAFQLPGRGNYAIEPGMWQDGQPSGSPYQLPGGANAQRRAPEQPAIPEPDQGPGTVPGPNNTPATNGHYAMGPDGTQRSPYTLSQPKPDDTIRAGRDTRPPSKPRAQTSVDQPVSPSFAAPGVHGVPGANGAPTTAIPDPLAQPSQDTAPRPGRTPEEQRLIQERARANDGETRMRSSSSSSSSSQPVSASSKLARLQQAIRAAEATGLPAFQGMSQRAQAAGIPMPEVPLYGTNDMTDPRAAYGPGGSTSGYSDAGNYGQPGPGGASPGSSGASAVVQGLVDRGLPLHVAQGFAGNFAVESNFDTTAVGDGGAAYGLAQWNDRRAALFEFARSRGKDPSDFDVQLDFVVHELRTTERRAAEKIMATSDPITAARMITRYYERPGIPHMDRRIAETRRIAGV